MRPRFIRLLWRGGAGDEDPLACREFVELVTDYLEDALPPEERASMDDHMRICEGCVTYLEQIRMTVRSLGAVPEPPADPHVRESLLRAFRELRSPGGAAD